MKGLWVLDPDEINDDKVLQLFGRSGELKLPIVSEDYITWLEDRFEELQRR